MDIYLYIYTNKAIQYQVQGHGLYQSWERRLEACGLKYLFVSSAVNNHKPKRVFYIISSIFPRKHCSCLDTLRELAFVKVNCTL